MGLSIPKLRIGFSKFKNFVNVWKWLKLEVNYQRFFHAWHEELKFMTLINLSKLKNLSLHFLIISRFRLIIKKQKMKKSKTRFYLKPESD